MKKIKKILYILIFSLVLMPVVSSADQVETLIEKLGDSNAFTREEIITLLGEIADERAIEPLAKLMHNEDKIMRFSAAKALGIIGTERAVKELMKSARSSNPEQKQMAIIALGMTGYDQNFDFLVSNLKDENWQTRWATVISLGMLGQKRATPYLKELFNDRYLFSSTQRYPIREAARASVKSILSSINWHKPLSEGLKIARVQKKPLLVYFHIWENEWCEKMENWTLKDKRIVNLAENFVCTKVNAYNKLSISDRYDVRLTPSIIILDPEGNEISRASGYVAVKSLKDKLEYSLEQLKENDKLKSWWNSANTLMDQSKIDEAIPILQKIIANNPADKSDILANAKFTLAYCYGKKRKYRQSIKQFTELFNDYPNYEKGDKLLYCLGLSYLKLGKYQEGINALETIPIKYPDSKIALNAEHLLKKLAR